jgi:O-antigen/teichoic acid export membrane protein
MGTAAVKGYLAVVVIALTIGWPLIFLPGALGAGIEVAWVFFVLILAGLYLAHKGTRRKPGFSKARYGRVD